MATTKPKIAGTGLHRVETDDYINVFFIWNNGTRNNYNTFMGHINKATGVFHRGKRYNEVER